MIPPLWALSSTHNYICQNWLWPWICKIGKTNNMEHHQIYRNLKVHSCQIRSHNWFFLRITLRIHISVEYYWPQSEFNERVLKKTIKSSLSKRMEIPVHTHRDICTSLSTLTSIKRETRRCCYERLLNEENGRKRICQISTQQRDQLS